MESVPNKNVVVVVAIFIAVITINVANSGFSNAQTICNMPVSGLRSCQPSVTPPNPTPPTRACCDTLSHGNLACLCSYKSMLPSLGIDPKLAMQLPKKCKLPSPANC